MEREMECYDEEEINILRMRFAVFSIILFIVCFSLIYFPVIVAMYG